MEVEQQDELAEFLINSLKRKDAKKATKAIEKGADPNYIGPEGFAAIHLAAGLDGCVGQQLLTLMLRYGGDPNLKSSDSETALHVSVMWNRETATRMLLAHGADPTIRNLDGLTAFDLAENTSDHEQKCLDVLRNGWNDNSSESDFSPNERTVLFVPNSDYKHGSRNHKLRESLMSPKRKSTEFVDVVDGTLHNPPSGFLPVNGLPVPYTQQYSPSSNKKASPPNYFQFPYNPMWLSGQESFTNRSPSHRQYSETTSVPATGKDSFFDLSIRQNGPTQTHNSNHFQNEESFNSDTQNSIDTAFTWDSDIDSSTSYFSLPKNSLKGLITELKDGEETYMMHKGLNGEASVIVGSDFDSRISLGEVPFSLIKNTNESIISDQLKRNSGRRSAEKLFLRRAKLMGIHSGKKSRKSRSNFAVSPEPTLNGQNGHVPERPRYFRSPFPLLNIPSPSFGQSLDRMNEKSNSRMEVNLQKAEHPRKVDKMTQKYFESPTVNGRPVLEEHIENVSTQNEMKSNSWERVDSLGKRQTLSRQTQTHQSSMSSLPPGTSVGTGSADLITRTPTTDETLSQPGNEETEIEFPIMHTFGSPRNLYSDNNETPVAATRTRTLFDQTMFASSRENQNLPDGQIFKFAFGVNEVQPKVENNGNRMKHFSAVQRKIDVLSQIESDVFTTDADSANGESDSSSSGYSGDLSQASPDDVIAGRQRRAEAKNSPSVTVRSKRRKDIRDERAAKTLTKQSSSDSNDAVEADVPDDIAAALPDSPRRRLNGVTSSSDEVQQAQSEKSEECAMHRSASFGKNPGRKIRQKIDHTFEEHPDLKSPLLPEELRSYHKEQLNKPIRARKKWEHKYDCKCELCMTRKGHTIIPASLPHCDHEQCHDCKETAFDDVTVDYDWKDVSLLESANTTEHSVAVPEEVQALNLDELKQRLVKAGEKPGPITNNTKNIYMKYLAMVEAGVVKKGPNSSFMEYVPEMRKELMKVSSQDHSALEEEVMKDFENPQKHKWREGIQKTSFNYILLDPRVTAKLKAKDHNLDEDDMFSCFVRSIFYIGKGKESRPYEHLHDALKLKKSSEQGAKASEKLKMILNIWQSGYGVVSLHLFHNVIPVEAYTREACMIEAMGLTRLTNLKKGDFYGSAASWKMKKKRHLGIHLLKKALQIFLIEGEKQIRETDL